VINPELGVERSWSVLEVKTPADLSKLLLEKTRELRTPQQGGTDNMRAMMMRMFGGRSAISTGIQGAEVFNYDVNLLPISKDLLGFGRLDIRGDDGVWFKKGLTEQGKAALAVLEENSIVLHCVQPTKATLVDLLEKAKKPFLVSGFTEFDADLIAKINQAKVVIGVDFNPADVDGAAMAIEAYKEKFGDTDNLLLNVTSGEGLDEAKQILYMKLIEKGWEKKEIYAIGGAGESRRSQGNLDRFGGGGPAFRRGR
jgi:hypothetical protein